MISFDLPVTRAIYFAVLRADDPSPLLPESDEEAAQRGATPSRPDSARADTTRRTGRGTGAPVSAMATAGDSARGTTPVTVRIDLANISQRILSLDVPARNYTRLESGTAGVVFFSEVVENQQGQTLHRYDVKKRSSAPFLVGVNSFALSANGKRLLYSQPGQPGSLWGVVSSEGTVKVGDGRLRTDLRAVVDPREEWRQIFREAWRLQRDFFYVDNVHGANWDEIYRMYALWVEHVGHRSDLTYLLDILAGELSVGHSFVSEGDVPPID